MIICMYHLQPLQALISSLPGECASCASCWDWKLLPSFCVWVDGLIKLAPNYLN